MNEKDPYIGEVFEDKDYRSHGRRIRILELHPKQYDARGPGDRTYYRAIRVDEFGEEHGQRVKISDHTLNTGYRKVSH